MSYLRMTIGRWNLDLDSSEAQDIFRRIQTEGVSILPSAAGLHTISPHARRHTHHDRCRRENRGHHLRVPPATSTSAAGDGLHGSSSGKELPDVLRLAGPTIGVHFERLGPA
jgi:hypothetical protein